MGAFKLYEISSLLQQAIDAAERTAVDLETGEIIDEGWSDFLEAVQMERDQKTLDCARYVKGLDAEAAAIREEEKTLAQRRKRAENRSEWLRGYIASCIEVGEKLQDTTVLLSWRKSQSVEISDSAIIPLGYCRTVITPDKIAIKEELKKGTTITGCQLVEKQSLQIK